MEPKNPESLLVASSVPSANADLGEEQSNLDHRLNCLNRKGDAGLQESLDRIYPPTGLVRKPLGGILSNSYAQYSERNQPASD